MRRTGDKVSYHHLIFTCLFRFAIPHIFPLTGVCVDGPSSIKIKRDPEVEGVELGNPPSSFPHQPGSWSQAQRPAPNNDRDRSGRTSASLPSNSWREHDRREWRGDGLGPEPSSGPGGGAVGGDNTGRVVVFSAAAIAEIEEGIRADKFGEDRHKALEPHYMVPTPNLNDYSKVWMNRYPLGKY